MKGSIIEALSMMKKSQTVKANLGITPATQHADQLPSRGPVTVYY